MDYNQPSLL